MLWQRSFARNSRILYDKERAGKLIRECLPIFYALDSAVQVVGITVEPEQKMACRIKLLYCICGLCDKRNCRVLFDPGKERRGILSEAECAQLGCITESCSIEVVVFGDAKQDVQQYAADPGVGQILAL